VTGFAVDFDRVDVVEIWVDGTYVGNAEYGFPTPEVEDMFPWFHFTLTRDAGFQYEMDTSAQMLADGEHSLVVWTEDRFGARTIIGERRWVLDNQSP